MTLASFIQHDAQPPLAPAGRALRVLHVMPSLFGGGMEHALVRLIERFSVRNEHRQPLQRLDHAVCLLGEGDEQLIQHCRQHGSLWIIPSQRFRPSVFRLRQIIGCYQPDVVHARSTAAWFDATVASRLGRRCKLVLGFHGQTEVSAPSWRRRFINRWTTHRADAVAAVSRQAAQMMHHDWQVAENKLFTIINGVDTRQYRPAEHPQEIQSLRQQHNIAPDEHLVVCVANLLPIKGLDDLLRAWRKVVMADPKARLWLIGDGPLRSALEQLVQQSRCRQNVQFLGPRRDVADLLRAADMFVLPSRYEGTSNALLEAMSTALAVVATSVGGTEELIANNENGWLVPPDNPERLAEVVCRALMDRAARLRVGQAARRTVLDHFSIETWLDRHEALYRRLTIEQQSQPVPLMEDIVCAG